MSVVTVPAGSVLCDTSAHLSPAQAAALAASSYEGRPLVGVVRYVSRGPAESAQDVDPAELQAILDAGLLVGLVQHCALPGWGASAASGAILGQTAAEHAQRVGYEAGCHLALDLEGCATVGAAVADYVEAWCAQVSGEGYAPLLYVGYSAGLTPAELGALPSVHAYWSDAAGRSVVPRGVCLTQRPTVVLYGVLGGVEVDPDLVTADARGGLPLLMGR